MDAPLPPPRRGLSLLLPDHHRRIEAMCNELLSWAHADDLREIVARWSELEVELLDHLAAEEEVILPSYSAAAPADARRIRDDHARIREVVTPIGIDVELHEVRIARLRRLVDELAAHSAHEDAVMYPWAEQNLPEVTQHLIAARIGRWLGRP